MAGFAAWAPIIASAVGGLASSQGSKKAARQSKPDIPDIFKGPIGAALGLIRGGMFGGAGGNPFLVGRTSSDLGALGEALRTIQGVASTGLDPATIRSVQDTLAPFFGLQKEQGVAGVREAQAAGGRFFGSGGVAAESDFLRKLTADQAATILPIVLQSQALRLQAAGAIPGFLGQEQNLGLAPFSALASLMGGTPFFQPAVPTNFLQSFGGNLSDLAASRAFLDFFTNRGFNNSAPAGRSFAAGFTNSNPPPR